MFQKCFAPNRERIVSSGGDNAEDEPSEGAAVVVGNKGESYHSRDERSRCEHSRARQRELKFELKLKSYVITMAPLRAQIGWDVKENYLEEALLKSGRIQGQELMAKSTLAAKGIGQGTTSPPEAKRKATWKFATPPSKEEDNKAASVVAAKEGTSTNLITSLGPRATILKSSTTTKKFLENVIPPFDKEEAASLEGEITQAYKFASDLEGQMAELKVQEQQTAEELTKARDNREAIVEKLAKLEVVVAELRNNEARSKRLAIEEFQSSNDF
ncbi:hypothetical protein Acr_07g0013840 [Actinidia rufa]|uniref:Uncharacterized protein n=1 Tax=Actinidia rufa TaxID=165716 RepID=A0A7J0EXP6_9ERIC|nr:hypothetical protein Acr_07g0013840 [Actinidia rufa]